jgi:hypothetical protein
MTSKRLHVGSGSHYTISIAIPLALCSGLIDFLTDRSIAERNPQIINLDSGIKPSSHALIFSLIYQTSEKVLTTITMAT